MAAAVPHGHGPALRAGRASVLDAAHAVHPERLSARPRPARATDRRWDQQAKEVAAEQFQTRSVSPSLTGSPLPSSFRSTSQPAKRETLPRSLHAVPGVSGKFQGAPRCASRHSPESKPWRERYTAAASRYSKSRILASGSEHAL